MKDRTPRSFVAPFLAAVAIAVTPACPALGQSDSQGMSAAIVDLTGERYVAARATALGLPKEEFELLMGDLLKSGPASPAAVVASALSVRHSSPALAQEFDSHIKESVEKPDMGSRSGRPQYNAWWPKDRPELDPLVFEVIVKRTVPDPLRHEFITGMSRPNRANVNAILAIADMEGITYAGMLRGATAGSVSEQDRITPVIVEIHKKWRSKGQISSGGVYALSTFGRAPQLAALKAIREFERQRATEEGLEPWSEVDVRKLFESALVDLNGAQVQLDRVRDAEGDPAEERRASKNVQAMKFKADALQKRCHLRELWVELEQRISTLEEALASKPPSASEASTSK